MGGMQCNTRQLGQGGAYAAILGAGRQLDTENRCACVRLQCAQMQWAQGCCMSMWDTMHVSDLLAGGCTCGCVGHKGLAWAWGQPWGYRWSAIWSGGSAHMPCVTLTCWFVGVQSLIDIDTGSAHPGIASTSNGHQELPQLMVLRTGI